MLATPIMNCSKGLNQAHTSTPRIMAAWYSALACAGALAPDNGFTVANTMGRLMQEALIGEQVVYPVVGPDWVPDPALKSELLALVRAIDARGGQTLSLSIDLGGMVVLAGDAGGLAAFEEAVPQVDGRFPMRLRNHAAFHSPLQAPVAERGRVMLSQALFAQPDLPLIDGRGTIWWPGATEVGALWNYTLDQQVTEPYDFAHAVRVAAREFAPDLFIVTGPGTTLGGAVAQTLIGADWRGMGSKAAFQAHQAEAPVLAAMGMDEQRTWVT